MRLASCGITRAGTCCRPATLGEAGSLTTLPIAFNTRAGVHLFAGEFTEAAAMAAEAESVSEATSSSIAPYGALALAVFRGQEAEATALIETTRKDVEHRGEGEGLTFVHWATAVLGNGLARYEDALAAAEKGNRGLAHTVVRQVGAGRAHRGSGAKRGARARGQRP
jgi:hypothetical protein